MLAMMMCALVLAACGGSDDDSESSVHASKRKREGMNDNAKTVYTVTNNFCQKCITYGTKTDILTKTEILTVTPGGDDANYSSLGTTPGSDKIIAELQKAVNSNFNDFADGYVYYIEFTNGFPSAVYISEKDDESFVGRYPNPMEDDENGSYSLKSFLD